MVRGVKEEVIEEQKALEEFFEEPGRVHVKKMGREEERGEKKAEEKERGESRGKHTGEIDSCFFGGALLFLLLFLWVLFGLFFLSLSGKS